jgi:phosphoadenosine phosphosulfate reductase
LFQETYDVFIKRKEVQSHIEVYFPEATAVQNLLNAKGPNSFMSRLKIEKSVVLSKVAPLTKALKEIQFDYGFKRAIRKQK